MDICSHIGMSVSEDANSFHKLSVNPPLSTCSVSGNLAVNDLGKDITETLNVKDKDGVEEGVCGGPQQSKLTAATSEKFLGKSATFPSSSTIEPSGASRNSENDIRAPVIAESGHTTSGNMPYTRSTSLPTPLKLVSALKGSREKLGTPRKQMTVRWAPDVYDPTPTAVSHVATNKNQRRRSDNSKKNGKNKHKGGGKHSRGSRGSKDKKQDWINGGSSNIGFKPLDEDDRLVGCSEHPAGIVDFHVGSPDPYCGSSFLKKSVPKLHFSIAEAT